MTSTPDPIAAEASAQYGAADERGPATPSAVLPTLRGNEENWVNQPANKAQSPIVQAGNLKESNGTIQTWDGSAPLTLTNPDGSDIRSLYFPNLPNPVTVFVGPASATAGGVWTTSESSEVVLLPTAINVVTVKASTPFGKSVQVFATNDVLSPIAPYVTIVGDLITVSTSEYPQGATPFSDIGTFTSTGPESLPSQAAPAIGQQLYIKTLYIRGLEDQRLAFDLQIKDAGTHILLSFAFNSGRDVNVTPSTPIATGAARTAGAAQYVWSITNVDGVANVDYIISGYYL